MLWINKYYFVDWQENDINPYRPSVLFARPFCWTWANSAGPGQTPQNATSELCLQGVILHFIINMTSHLGVK